MVFSAAELADLRAEQAASFDKICVVSNPGAEVDDLAGGTTPGTPTETTVNCRIGSPRAIDQEVANRLGIVVDTMVTLPYGTTVSNRATITCTTNGKSYEVTHINTEQSYQTAVRAMCQSIRSEA